MIMYEWFLAFASVMATLLVAKYKDKPWGFYVYIVIDFMWAIADYQSMLWARFTRHVIYVIIAFYGAYKRRNV